MCLKVHQIYKWNGEKTADTAVAANLVFLKHQVQKYKKLASVRNIYDVIECVGLLELEC